MCIKSICRRSSSMVTVVMCNYLPSLSKRYILLFGYSWWRGLSHFGNISLLASPRKYYRNVVLTIFFCCHLQNACCIFYCYDLLCVGLGASWWAIPSEAFHYHKVMNEMIMLCTQACWGGWHILEPHSCLAFCLWVINMIKRIIIHGCSKASRYSPPICWHKLFA